MLNPDQTTPTIKTNSEGENPRFDFNRHPSLVIWELTSGCPFQGRFTKQHQRNPLSLREAFRVIDLIKAARPSLLILTAGDLVNQADLNGIIARAADNGLRVALSPTPCVTPLFLTADLHALKRLGLRRICLKLNGATSEVHDEFLGIQGSWKCTMEAIQRAKAAGIETQIETTFTRRNRAEYEALSALLLIIKPSLWNVSPLIRNEASGAIAHSEVLNSEEAEKLLVQLCALKANASYEITTTDAPQFRRIALQHHEQSILKNLASTSLNDGRGQVFINHLGEITPGPHLPLVAGSVRETKLIDTYRNSRVFRELRNPSLLKGKCGYCEFNSICGGSRARAYAATGDYLAQDPLCDYHPRAARSSTGESWRMYCDD